MNRAKKNKRKHKKKNKMNNRNNNKLENNKNDDKLESNENDNNAAPLMGPLKEDQKDEDVKENCGPPEDASVSGMKGCASILNKMERINLNFNNYEKEELEESKPLKYMQKVNEDDLELNNIHYNCYIILEITSAVMPIFSLQFTADDENNNRMLISVYNYQGKFTAKSFKQGNYMIIKERPTT